MKRPLSLNVYLLEKGVVPFKEIDLAGFRPLFRVPVGRNNYSDLYYKMSGAEPDWLKSLKFAAGYLGDAGQSSSPQALLFFRKKQRWFVITFGHAWQKVANAKVVPDFGTRCVLNIAEQNSLVSIRRDRIADSSIQAIEQIPDTDDISRFGLDVEQDMLRGVKAKVDGSYKFGNTVVGGDSFKGTIDLADDDIASFCRRILRQHGMDAVSKNFSWFGKIKPVLDGGVIAGLEKRLVRALSLRVKSITLSIPDFLAWDEYDIFSYAKAGRKHMPVSEPLDPIDWRNAHVHGSVTKAVLDAAFVYAYKTGNNHLITKWPLRRCINATIKFGSGKYITQNGKWYKVDSNFVEEVARAVADIDVDNIAFPRLKSGESERGYNERMGRDFASRYFYLDRKLLHVTGRSSIEVCDLLRFDGAMVCVKSWGGKSQHLSHLFQQAVVAGQLVASHPPFVAAVGDIVDRPGFNAVWFRESAKRSDATIVLATMRGVAKEKLPFFAQVGLVMCVRNLKQMRYSVKYAAIK
ncbi:DUF6119 family protein [Lysobacter antibioticus]|uniref:DUF6119 family protein n=1 Tax=Lysobacter antibioticus TaxID=84531 RepID=UPI000ABDCA2D|nr:DUF6119 family protein [Lysobacter antibioticus]